MPPSEHGIKNRRRGLVNSNWGTRLVYARPGPGLTKAGKYTFEVGVGKYKLGTRAVKYELGARAGKHKLGTRAGKYKLEARAEGREIQIPVS